MRYKIIIEYNGFDYLGWQKQAQKQGQTIEEIIQNAIFLATQENVDVMGSGRTDAGVHAIAQVAHFDLVKNFEPFRLNGALNNYLRLTNVSIISCQIVDDNFHSRFDAKMRHYQYKIINRKAPLTIMRNFAWHVANYLDFEEMQKAAKYLLGTHDFSAFQDAECQSKSPIKTISKIEIKRNNDEIIINCSAKSFLHHMVRNIVGTLIWVGCGKIKAQDITMILEKRDRTLSGPNAPAYGLYFMGVDY